MRILCITLISLFLVLKLTGQENDKQKRSYHHLPAIGFGGGALSFIGDVGNNSPAAVTSSIRLAYAFSVEQRFGAFLGAELKGNYGFISKNEQTDLRNLNFETSMTGGELSLNIYLDNILSKKQLNFAPYFGFGAGYYMFNPYGDLLDAFGEKYFYWDDGTIRNMSQSNENFLLADTLRRDYTYETRLGDSIGYQRSTLVFPVQFGLRFKMSDNLSANLSASYYFTQTDYIDNVQNGSFDAFINGRATLVYHFGGYDNNRNPLYDNVDFASIDKEDADADGVRDHKDKCPGTEAGVQVDGKGCPVDSDKDGVPDYRDEEENTEKGVLVDEKGVTLTEELQVKLSIDSLATDRERIKEEYPSLYGLLVENNEYPNMQSLGEDFKNTSSSLNENGIPNEFSSADRDSNGIITTSEIYEVIDGFFEGSNGYNIKKIHRLIAFFFEQ